MLNGYLYINEDVMPTLLAVSSEEQAQGLMFVPPPAPVMSFVYRHPQVNRFWMQNTISPLDIVFCLNGKINKICKGSPLSTEIIGGFDLSDLVVELPEGTCNKLGFKIGDKIGLVKNVDELYIIEQIKNKLYNKLNI